MTKKVWFVCQCGESWWQQKKRDGEAWLRVSGQDTPQSPQCVNEDRWAERPARYLM